MSIIERAVGALRSLVPAQETAVARPRVGSAYMRGGRGILFNGWRPPIREAQDDVVNAWDHAAARTADAVHNSGWLAGAIEQAVSNTVGTGLRLRPMPENTTFGMTEDAAREWAILVSRRFELWARDPQECDIEGLRTFGQMQAVQFATWLAFGESLAELPWRRRPWNTYGTKVRLLPPTRLLRKTQKTQRLYGGVYTDGDGMPIAYAVENDDPIYGKRELTVRARDGYGRKRVIHVFHGAPGTYRGIGPLTPALQVARQFDQLADATLTSAIMRTLFAASITGDAPTEEVTQALLTPQEQARMVREGISPFEVFMDASAAYYEAASVNLGANGRVAHLFPGEKLEFHTPDLQGDDYKTFSQHLLRELARCLGLTFESATGDYTGATYSSVRMATGEIHAVTKVRRQLVVGPFCQAAYEAWLEEEIESGAIPFPGGLEAFLGNRAAACRADWLGSPKPQADDLKTAKAHEVWSRMGVIPDGVIANDLGLDIEDVYAERRREMDLRQHYGLPEPALMSAGGGGAGGDAVDPNDGGTDPGDGSRGS